MLSAGSEATYIHYHGLLFAVVQPCCKTSCTISNKQTFADKNCPPLCHAVMAERAFSKRYDNR